MKKKFLLHTRYNLLPAKKAFTLIEVLLAVTILSTGLVLVVHAFLTVVNGMESARNYVTGTLLLEGKMGEILDLAKRTEGGITALETEGEFEDYPGYKWELDVTDSSYDELLNEVTVNVGWNFGRRKGSVSATTLIMKPPEDED